MDPAVVCPTRQRPGSQGATGADAEWWGNYYNNFSATSGNGKTSLFGRGNIGVKVLGSDCVYQMFVQGS